MKVYSVRLIALAALFACPFAFAQTAATASADSSGETIQLNPFVVSTAADRGYVSTNAISATRVDTPIKDLPLPIAVLNRQYLQDRDAQNLNEAMRFTAAFDPATNRIRGLTSIFDTNINRNGAGVNARATSSNSQENLVSVDRVELFKGPSSIINGFAQPGGTINFVTKRPAWRDQGFAQVQVGSFDQQRGMLEYHKVLVPNKVSIMGVVAARNQGQTNDWKQDFDDRSRNLYLAGVWRPWRGGEFNVDVGYDKDRENLLNTTAFNTLPGSNLLISGYPGHTPTSQVPYALALGMPLDYAGFGQGAYRNNARFLPTASFAQSVGGVNLFARYTFQDRDEKQFTPSTVVTNTYPGAVASAALGRNLFGIGRRWTYIERQDQFHELEFRVQYKFDLNTAVGKLRNDLYGQFTDKFYYYDWNQYRDRPSTARVGVGDTASNVDVFQYFALESLRNDPNGLRAQALPLPGAFNFLPEFHDVGNNEQRSVSVRYKPELETGVGKFIVLAGANKSWQYQEQNDTFRENYSPATGQFTRALNTPGAKSGEWYPSYGVVYQPRPWLSIYGSATKSYTFQFRRNSFNDLLPNELGKSREFGVKAEALDGAVVGTVSWYDTKYGNRPLQFSGYPVKNAILQDGTVIQSPADQARWDPIRNPIVSGAGSESIASGEFRSKGVDADLVLSPTRDWQMTLGYNLADAKTTFDNDVRKIGRREPNHAKHTVALFTNYKFRGGVLAGLEVGGGYRWSSKRLHSGFGDAAGNGYINVNGVNYLFEKDGDKTVDLLAKYNFKLSKYASYVQLNVFNLLRERQYAGYEVLSSSTTANPANGYYDYTFKRPVWGRVTLGVRF